MKRKLLPGWLSRRLTMRLPRRLPMRLPTLRGILSFFKDVVVRVYSLAVFVLLCWAGWLATTYLRDSVFRPTHIPSNLLEWQGRLDVAALRQQNVPGTTGTAGRAPPGHYHGVDRWFQADSRNTCTTAGCHEALPHTSKMKVPAFANFHTTFLACQMCHTDVHNAGVDQGRIVWLSMSSGQVQDLPPILELLRFLDERRDQIAQNPAAADPTITTLLQQTLSSAGPDPALDALLAQLQSAVPGGPVWRQAVEQLKLELPQHTRGEYAAKLAPKNACDPASLQAKATASMTAEYLAAPAGDARARLKDALHAPLLKQATSCVACHGDQPPLLNFEALGYSPQRGAALRNLPLARVMQQIREGQRFFIPNILEAR